MSKKVQKTANTKKRDFSKFIPWIAGIGLLATIELIIVFFNANFIPDATPSFCTLSEKIDCDAVARTDFSVFLGIPNAIWGFLVYAFILVLYFAKKLKEIKLFKFLEVFEHPKSYIFLISLIMSLGSIILFFVSTMVIKKICIMCFFTYILNFILLFISKPSKSFVDIIITTINDFIKAISNKIYAIAFFLVVIAGISGIIYLENTKLLYPPEDFMSFEATETSNNLGSPDAKVIINEFTDIQCPFCALSNKMVNKVVSEYDNVRVLHHDMPLDMDCNPLLKSQMHPNSCLYAQYAIAAKKQNKSWGLINAMFKNNDALTEEKVLELAKELNMNVATLKKDAHSASVKNELKEEIEATIDMNINGTPTYIINGERHEGIYKNYRELEKVIVKNGGVKKKK